MGVLMGAVTSGTPGYVLGGALIGVGLVAAWLWWSRRRFLAEVRAETGVSFRGVVPVPGTQPRPVCGEPVTQLLARVSDERDATVVMPRYREATRG